MGRDEALELLHEYTQSESLRAHARRRGRHAATPRPGGDEETVGNLGLLHDFDYERFPTSLTTPQGAEILRQQAGREVVEGCLAHAPFTEFCATRPLKRAIFAVDDSPADHRSGASSASRRLRGGGESVRKKMKNSQLRRGRSARETLSWVGGEMGCRWTSTSAWSLEPCRASPT